jgi:thiol-disulfide isomerase/thioredoxin
MTGRTVRVAIAGLLLAGCAAGSGTAAPAGTPAAASLHVVVPSTGRLLQAAGLRPCPSSSGAAVAGGLPRVSLRCLGAGPAVRLSGLRGMPTLLAIWAAWCADCQREAPLLQRIWGRSAGRLRVLGVLFDDEVRDALDFDAAVRVHYPSVVDPQGTVSRALLHVPGPPALIFVNAAGRVVYRQYGPLTTLAEARPLLRRYFDVSL